MDCTVLLNNVTVQVHIGETECCVFMSILLVREELGIYPLKLKVVLCINFRNFIKQMSINNYMV
jgi:hypothetical protein